MPDKQSAVDFKVVVKGVDDLALHFIVKVDDNVAAENNLRFFNAFELFPVIEVNGPKGNERLQFRLDPVLRVFLDKVSVHNFLWGRAQGLIVVNSGQHGLGKVIGCDLDVPAGKFTFQHFTQYDGKRVGFFARGTASRPDTQLFAPCLAALVKNVGQHTFLKNFKLRWIAEKACFVGCYHFKKLGELCAAAAVKAQKVVIVAVTLEVQFLDAV